MREPVEPEHSCPHIDEAINEMEKARKIHDNLRKWGSYWNDRCIDLQHEIYELQKNIKTLERDIDDLKDENHYLKSQIDK